MKSRNKINKRFLILILACSLPLLKSAAEQGYQIFQLHQESVRKKKVQQLKAENMALEQEKENWEISSISRKWLGKSITWWGRTKSPSSW